MKIKSVKYNPKGLKREQNSSPKMVLPKKDLNKTNTIIKFTGAYIEIKKSK